MGSFFNAPQGHSFRYLLWLIIVISFHDLTVIAARSKAKLITTVLDARWRHTPIISEVSEFLAEESNEYFWKYVDAICATDPEYIQQSLERERYELALSEASKLISVSTLNVLRLSLSLRIHSPKVEMFHQISLDKSLPLECRAVIEVNGELTCDLVRFSELLENASERNVSDIYQLDHHYPGTNGNPTIVILYGEIGTYLFREFHFAIQQKVREDPRINYIIRHYLPVRSNNRVRLSGFGVELAIKSTEYKAVDDSIPKEKGPHGDDENNAAQMGELEEVEGFIFSKLVRLHPGLKPNLENLYSNLVETTSEMKPLKAWQIQDLGLQAAQRIMSTQTDNALRQLRDIAQNFPLLKNTLTRVVVKDELRREISKNQNLLMHNYNVGPTDCALFVNGVYYDMDATDIFTLLDMLKSELKVMEGLYNLGVQETHVAKLLALDLKKGNQQFAVDIRDTAVQYINDLESDSRYSKWSSSIQEMLRPTFPGMMRSVRKNIFHSVFILDPSQTVSGDLLKFAESFYVHSAPVRIGLVLLVNRDMTVTGLTDAGVAMLNAYNFISQDKGGNYYYGLSFLTDVHGAVGNKEITSSDVIAAFLKQFPGEDTDLIFGLDSDYDSGRKLAWDFVDRTGIGAAPKVLVNGIPLDESMLNGDLFEDALVTEIMYQTPEIQTAVYKGKLTDMDVVLDHVMSGKQVMPRLNYRILESGDSQGKKKNAYETVLLDMTGKPHVQLDFKTFSQLSSAQQTATLIAHNRYLTRKDGYHYRQLTLWVVCDLTTVEGRQLLRNAALKMKESNDIRLAVIHNSDVGDDQEGALTYLKAIQASFVLGDKVAARILLSNLLWEDTAVEIIAGKKDFVKGELKNEFDKLVDKCLTPDLLAVHRLYSRTVVGFKSGENGVVVNGRVLGPLPPNEIFTEQDFDLLEKYVSGSYGDQLKDIFEEMNSVDNQNSVTDLSMRVSALLLSRTVQKQRHTIKLQSTEHSVVHIPPRFVGQPAFDLLAVVDPLSRCAQKLTPIIMTLHEAINSDLKVFLNAQEKLSDLPLKSFFRYVVEPELQFSPVDDSLVSVGPMAVFAGMPAEHLLTLHYHVPDNWLVEVMRSHYDLDNIKLEEASGTVHGEFELAHLLVEGHCFDQISGNPPRGLQYTLGTRVNPSLVDTIVMANLGYLQLKANPGAWLLRLRQGRSFDIYNIVSHDGTDTPKNSTDVQVLISSFRSNIIKIRVSKKQDMLHEDLMGDEGKPGIWNSITSTFSKSELDASATRDDVINIFSLASGHLYERFLRIMMLSVLKNTKTPVKFWFLKNYLSPQFKDLLPAMAEEFKFDYELVQYQWPRWLHQQTEKQRVIWGYKILFLDVLFPLDVKKIIFVDADQVIRADMKDLVDLDLEGAPYGYTPFCDSRTEMEGFRFWKSGYWSTHLQHRKYHISALYVVDLKKFRRIAAGDRLRGQYQGLSQDPNSLSNLDQDLPNNMIHQVAIKSLPQEWLWCETWCDEGSKSIAKTIDLCNNPKTKEPKLVSAMRIIPEWNDYDTEIKRFISRYESDKLSRLSDSIQDGSLRGVGLDPEISNILPDSIDEASHEHGEL